MLTSLLKMKIQVWQPVKVLDYYRTRQWWLNEQAKPHTGIRHPKHYPRLSNLEKDMDYATGGKPWREVAADRVQWQQCRERWICNMDVPWTGGRQTCIRDEGLQLSMANEGFKHLMTDSTFG